MPRDISSAVLAEAIKDRVTVVDLLQVTFPSEIGVCYWANYPYVYGGHNYTARVLEVGSWSRSMNPESDTLSITLGNADGYLTEIANKVEIEQAQIKLVRYFPEIGQAIDPLWIGYGGSIELTEEKAVWEIYFGFRGFRHKGLRKYSQNCWKIFSDRGKSLNQNLGYCPYHPWTLSYFRCGRFFSITQYCGVDDNEIHLEPTDGNGTAEDYLRVNDEIQASNPPYEIMRVVSVSGGTVEVERGIRGTEQSSHTTSDNCKFYNCAKSKQDCERRGMYGPPTNATGIGYQSYNTMRWFGGWSEHIPVTFTGHYYVKKKLRKKIYSQSTVGNETLMGDVIPVIWGTYRLRGIEAVAMADAKEFRHALFVVAEGECSGIAYNLVRVKGLPVDDCPSVNSKDFNPVEQESLVVWWGGMGNGESSHNMRQAYGIMTGVHDSRMDTYLNNPYLFSLADGDGPSLADMFALRVRVEEGGTDWDENIPDLDIQFNGRIVRTIQSYVEEPDVDPTQTEPYPDPVEVAVDYLTNKKFGARLDYSMIDLDEAQLASDYCRETVVSVDPHFNTSLTGTIEKGPGDVGLIVGSPKIWLLVSFSDEVRDGELSGRTIKITTAGKEQSKTIVYNHAMRDVDQRVDNIVGVYGFHSPIQFDYTVHMLQIQGEWDDGKVPVAGNSFLITGVSNLDNVPRFKFNGGLTQDDSVESQLATLLQNCNGYYVAREGKIAIKIKKAENLTYVDSLPWLTDWGSSRNIIRDNGVSSFRYKKLGISNLINQIDVEFCDVDNSFLSTTMHVYDEDSQQLYGKVISGNKGRVVNAKTLTLIGTTSKDQAMRLGALALREAAMERDSISFEMSLKDSLLLEPGDVRRLDTNPTEYLEERALGYNFPYIRVTKITENSKFTAQIEGHRHENGAYDDTFTMCVGYPTDAGNENPANFPMNVIPMEAKELIEVAKDGTILSVVEVEVTYPELT